MAKPELGTKRICPGCRAKFFDLQKSPAECPKCGETFQPDVEAKRPGPAAKAAVEAVPVVEPEKAATAAGVEVVSLEEADEKPDSQADDVVDIDIADDDADIDSDDEDTSEPFLETDDDDEESDVSGLIGGGISKGGEET